MNVVSMRNRNLILLFIICVTIVSCRTPRYIYSPAPPNNPYFREKGESKLAVYYSTGGDANELAAEYNNGYDVQGAYAISNHVALTADFFKRNEKDSISNYDRTYFDRSVVRYNRHITSFGGGFYGDLFDKHIYCNIYGGVGFGKYSFSDNGIDNGTFYTRDYKSHMTKWYIQPSINFFSKYLRTGLIGKMCWVHFDNISTSYTPAELVYLNLDRLPGRTLIFFEASWNLQATFKNMNWMFIEGSITASTDPFDRNTVNLEARNFNASIGVGFDFSKMKMKNKRK